MQSLNVLKPSAGIQCFQSFQNLNRGGASIINAFFFSSMLALAARYLCLAREHRLSPSLSRSSSSPHSCRSVHRAEAEFAFLVRAALVLCWLRGCRSCASRRSSSLPALSLPLSLSLSLSWALLFIYLFAREGARAHVHRARPSVSVSVSFSLKWGKIINKIRGVTLTSWRSLARG